MKRGRGRPRTAGADEEIRGVALEMLREKGYRELTVDAVAERAGVAKTTVYRRWPTKGALIAAAIAPLAETSGDIPDSGSLENDLTIVLRDTCALLNLIGQSDGDADMLDVIRVIIEPQRKRLGELLNRAGLDSVADLLTDILIGPLVARLLLTRAPLDDEFAYAVVRVALRR